MKGMDLMKISSGFLRGIVSKLIKRAVKKKGYNADIVLNEFAAKFENGEATIHLNLDAKMSQDELTKLLKDIGLG